MSSARSTATTGNVGSGASSLLRSVSSSTVERTLNTTATLYNADSREVGPQDVGLPSEGLMITSPPWPEHEHPGCHATMDEWNEYCEAMARFCSSFTDSYVKGLVEVFVASSVEPYIEVFKNKLAQCGLKLDDARIETTNVRMTNIYSKQWLIILDDRPSDEMRAKYEIDLDFARALTETTVKADNRKLISRGWVRAAQAQAPQTDFSNYHPPLMSRKTIIALIAAFATEGTVIFDPFAGTGTVLESAMREGRESIGIELDNAWFHGTAALLDYCSHHDLDLACLPKTVSTYPYNMKNACTKEFADKHGLKTIRQVMDEYGWSAEVVKIAISSGLLDDTLYNLPNPEKGRHTPLLRVNAA